MNYRPPRFMLHEDAMLKQAIRSAPAHRRIFLSLSRLPVVISVIRFVRPGYRNRGVRKAEVRQFRENLFRLIQGDALRRDFDIVSGLSDI